MNVDYNRYSCSYRSLQVGKRMLFTQKQYWFQPRSILVSTKKYIGFNQEVYWFTLVSDKKYWCPNIYKLLLLTDFTIAKPPQTILKESFA